MTRNEAARLPRTLASVPDGARVFVLDAESTDDTVPIARAAGAEVETRRWAGYVNARRYALGRVATPWTLMLDADEVLDRELRVALAGGFTADGYRLRRVTTFAGRPVRAAGWSAERLVRAFRTDAARLEAGSVGGAADLHERWVVNGVVADLPGTIVHDSYPTVTSYFAKFSRYSDLEAERLPPSWPQLALALAVSPLRLVWSMVRWGGWRDGWRGWFVSASSSVYPIAIRWKALRRR